MFGADVEVPMENPAAVPSESPVTGGQTGEATRTSRNRRKTKVRLNSRAAAYAAAVSTLLEIVPCITILLDRLVRGEGEGVETSREFRIVIFVSFGMYSLFALASLAFIAGIRKDERLLFIPWMAVLVALCVFEAAAIMIHKKQKSKHEVLENWEVVFMVSFLTRLIINIVALIMAMYHYKEVGSGRGRRQGIARQRNAQARNRRDNMNTVTDGRIREPPGVTMKPPPYSPEPPAYSYSYDTPPPSYSSQPNINLDSLSAPADGASADTTTPSLVLPPNYSERA